MFLKSKSQSEKAVFRIPTIRHLGKAKVWRQWKHQWLPGEGEEVQTGEAQIL